MFRCNFTAGQRYCSVGTEQEDTGNKGQEIETDTSVHTTVASTFSENIQS